VGFGAVEAGGFDLFRGAHRVRELLSRQQGKGLFGLRAGFGR
jgi:hypothetical protein